MTTLILAKKACSNTSVVMDWWLAAKILLSGSDRRIIVPSEDEWHGLNQLERDGEL